MAFGIYSLYRRFQPGFRNQRIRLFLEAFQPGTQTRILDVGGLVWNWYDVPIKSEITLFNTDDPRIGPPAPDRFHCQNGDGRHLPFSDRSFDIAFSNSTIEHVGTYEDQKQFANELRRVGRGLFVQTPNRWFFAEPHFVTVFVHYLPWCLAKRLIRFCSFRGIFRGGDNIDLRNLAAELRPLSYREMKELFPDCEIWREKWFGMTKSLIAVRQPV
jgi:hypothetical protein